jgi:hypothetical protein
MIQLALHSGDEEPSSRVVCIGGEYRKPELAGLREDIRLPTLLAHHVSDISECHPVAGNGTVCAIARTGRESYARKRLVPTKRTRTELPGEMLKAYWSVKPRFGIHQSLGLRRREFLSRPKESVQLEEKCVDVEGLVAVLPGACAVRTEAALRSSVRRRRDHDWGSVVEERIISERNAHIHGGELVEAFLEEDDVEATFTREL